MSDPFTALFDLGYRWGYRFGLVLVDLVPERALRWWVSLRGVS